jgi:hypothetical protein
MSEEIKRYPLARYVTNALKDELVEASKVSGRPLTQEIEARLLRTLREDRSKDPTKRRLENSTQESLVRIFRGISELTRVSWEAGAEGTPLAPGEFKWFL